MIQKRPAGQQNRQGAFNSSVNHLASIPITSQILDFISFADIVLCLGLFAEGIAPEMFYQWK